MVLLEVPERPIIILKEKPLPSPGWPHRLLFSIIKGTRCGPPQSWFRLRSADICLGSALGSTWFHLVPRPAHGGFAWGVRDLPCFRPWFHLVPRGSTTLNWVFRVGMRTSASSPPLVPLGSARFHDTFLEVSYSKGGGLALVPALVPHGLSRFHYRAGPRNNCVPKMCFGRSPITWTTVA